MEILHIFVLGMLLFCGFGVITSLQPIESALYLILAFCNAAILLFFFNVEFLGLLIIIIYVGAVAVLFLFIIMMLNIKKNDFIFKYTTLGFFSIGVFSFVLFVFFYKSFCQNTILFFDKHYWFISMFDNLNNIDVIGQILYNYYLICFLLAGLVLLIALIGAVVLTLRFNTDKKNQLVTRQLARNDNFLTFFK